MQSKDINLTSQVKSVFHTAREWISPVLKESKFKETGVLTPEEFVAAGDFLILKCPTWAWMAGHGEKRKDYLPQDKQYLITRNVPCMSRVAQMHTQINDEAPHPDQEEMGDGEEDFFLAGGVANAGSQDPQTIQDIDNATDQLKNTTISTTAAAAPGKDQDDIPDMDDIPDLDDEDLEGFGTVQEPEDAAALPTTSDEQDNILRTRTYDLSITYDKYYQTPRMWLSGFDEHRRPLTAPQIFQDISQDHAQKTCTIEGHPHEQITCASIHPCKHANVMKRLLDHMEESGEGREMRVDQYLMFMSSIIPTMEYDYTTSMAL